MSNLVKVFLILVLINKLWHTLVVGITKKFEQNKEKYHTLQDIVRSEIAEKTNNNYHYIQVAVLELAKFGFTHPEFDLSFVVDYSESHFKYSSSNKTRFLEASKVAKMYPQTRWAYDTRADQEEEDYVDYRDYSEQQMELPNKSNEDDCGGLVDYGNFFEKVIEKIKEGDRVGYEVALKELADIIRFKGSGIFTITGIPGHGKTEFLDVILLDLARLFKQQSFIAGFE